MYFEQKKWELDVRANNYRQYQQCSLSVMDTISDPGISFDENGVSNYFSEYKSIESQFVKSEQSGQNALEELIDKIRKDGKGKKYDCITGVSGGVDSTYLVLLAKKMGLNPLLVHFDNGWNSELAVNNIENIISRLGFDLYTLVVNWEEFRDIQLSYLKASVVDIEAITDHAILGTLYRLAEKNNVKYILSGYNVVTEGVLPNSWIWNKADHLNIRDIHKRFGTVPLKTFPFFSNREKQYLRKVKNIQTVPLLNYVPYVKDEVKKVISQELGWRDYGGKHYESIFTRFYQGYILPVKFGIDKRKAHLSTLIFSGQISKENALDALKMPIYDNETLNQDFEFVLKKLNLTESEFQSLMSIPQRMHTDFNFEKNGLLEQYPILKIGKPFLNIYRKIRH